MWLDPGKEEIKRKKKKGVLAWRVCKKRKQGLVKVFHEDSRWKTSN